MKSTYKTQYMGGRIVKPAWFMMAVCMCVMLCSSCADQAADPRAAWYGVDRPDAYESGSLEFAELSLTRHDVKGAYQEYADELAQEDALTEGTAAAGKAITGLFLLPERQSMRNIISQSLDATNSSYSTQRLVWGREGMLDLFHQGSSWEDDGIFVGVKTLLVDEFPWESRRLDNISRFVGPLNEPISGSESYLVSLAQDIYAIEGELQIALQDPRFEYFYLPASVFHDDELSFAVSKSELALLHGALSCVRGALYFLVAYEHRWSLTGLLSKYDERGVAYSYLDPLLLRKISDASYLNESRRAFQDGLDLFAQSITLGLAQDESSFSELSVVRWDRVDRDQIRLVRDVLQALSYSLDEPTKMPHFSQEFTLDLSPFFSQDGRVLSEDVAWFDVDPETGELNGLTEGAYKAFFVNDLYSPAFEDPQDAEFKLDANTLDEMMTNLFGQTMERVERAYGL